MNKVFAVVASIAALVLIWFLITPASTDHVTTDGGGTQDASSKKSSVQGDGSGPNANKNSVNEPIDRGGAGGSGGDDEGDSVERPASELYSSANEALDAVKKGASTYDDIILEQFVDLGKNCSWCDDFYSSVRSLAAEPGTPTDEKSYYAEILAISGRVDSIGELINGIESSASGDESDVFSEALEIAIGGDEVVTLLESKLSTQNSDLRESIVAAISNQGSSKAIESLYSHVRNTSNPDGYYSEGTGLGEVIPDEEAFPVLKDIVAKKDEFSHLGVKALLNSGLDGVKSVTEILANSDNPPRDKELLKDAVDHVNLDEETEKYFQDVVAKSANPSLAEWGRDVLESVSESERVDDDADEEEG